MKFWLHRNDNTEGPFPIDELQNRLRDGELSPDDQICPMGESTWQPLSSLDAPPVPPPPPPQGELPAPPGVLPPTPAARRRSLTIAIAAAAVVVTGIAATLIYLLNDPSRPLPKTASYVPKDSALVVTTHIGDLLKKGNVSDLLDKGILEEIGMPRPIRKKISDLFEDPAQFGLNMEEPVYFFMTPGPGKSKYPVFGFTIPILSREGFLDGLEDVVTLERRPDEILLAAIHDLKKNGTVAPDNEVAFGINDDVFVIVIQDIPYREREGRDEDAMAKVAEKVLEGGEGLVVANKSFAEHQTTLFDAGAWLNLGSLAGMVPADELEREFGQLGDLSKLKSFQITGSMHFGQGEITGDMALYYDEKLLGDWSGGGLGSELLDAVPEDTMMAISQSMNMEVVKKWFDDRPGIKKDMEEALQSELGMSLDEALGAFEGDLVLALTDLNMVRSQWGGMMPQPAILFGATIKDRSKVEKMLTEPMRELERDEDSYVRLVMRDNAFFICSPDDESDLKKNGKVDKPLSGEKRSLLADNDTGFFLDYQEMERVISRMGGDDEEVAIVVDAVGDLGLVTLTWNAEAGAQKIRARIRMPKEDENSLKQIVNSAFSATIAVNKRMRGGRNWDGPPTHAENGWPENAKEEEAGWEKATESTKPSFNEPNPNFGQKKSNNNKIEFAPKEDPRFNPNFGEKESKEGFAPKGEATPPTDFGRHGGYKSTPKITIPSGTPQIKGIPTIRVPTKNSVEYRFNEKGYPSNKSSRLHPAPTSYAHTKGHTHGHGEDAVAESPPEQDAPEELVPIFDPDDLVANHLVVANPKGSQGKRYIVAEVNMQRREPLDTDFRARVLKKTKLLQEIVTHELETQTIEDLQKPTTKELIRRNLQKEFNSVLKTPSYPAPVGKIVISKWIMQ